MGKTIAKNLTTRTVECHLPGGRSMRLRPGETLALKEIDRAAAAIRKLRRDRVLDVFDAGREYEARRSALKKRETLARRIEADRGHTPQKKAKGEQGPEEPLGDEQKTHGDTPKKEATEKGEKTVKTAQAEGDGTAGKDAARPARRSGRKTVKKPRELT